MSESKAKDVKLMFGRIAKRYDLSNDVLSFGMHRLWAKKAVNLLPDNPDAQCLDLCTGTGFLLPNLAKKYGYVIGLDFCEEMLAIAEKYYPTLLVENAELVLGDALNTEYQDNSFDIITVAYGVRNYEDLNCGLKEIYRILKPGGKCLIIEFGQPKGFFGTLYRFYSKTIMPSIGGILTGDKSAYTYLPETAKEFPCGDDFQKRLEQFNFKVEKVSRYTFGICYSYLITK